MDREKQRERYSEKQRERERERERMKEIETKDSVRKNIIFFQVYEEYNL